MGKKSKANRKKAPVATAAVTATAAVAVVATATATAATETKRGEFPESTVFVKGESFFKKGNYAKAQKIYLQGLEHGCVPCMTNYALQVLVDGATIDTMDEEMIQDNRNLHLALPLLLEGAIRGSAQAISPLLDVYSYAIGLTAAPIILYWMKHYSKNYDRGDGRKKQSYERNMKEDIGTACSECRKEDSETVTLMKCEGCHLCFYCSKECQQKMWQEGHAGVCRHLGILQKYHKPFAKKIWKDIAVHGIPPQDIPELQELRQQLGLSRPQADYQDLLEAVQAGRLDLTQLILPRKDGTVQIGSFPRPI